VEVANVTRPDAVEPTDIREDLLELAPQREGEFYRVPRILGEEA
jgi:aspartyl-tRNA(Asn)/glutamyl-tRNA(Gln) amidotransferase subunit C